MSMLNINYPATIYALVTAIASDGLGNLVVSVNCFSDSDCKIPVDSLEFVQTEDLTEAGVAVHKYGSLVIPDASNTSVTVADLELLCRGVKYTTATSTALKSLAIGSKISYTHIS